MDLKLYKNKRIGEFVSIEKSKSLSSDEDNLEDSIYLARYIDKLRTDSVENIRKSDHYKTKLKEIKNLIRGIDPSDLGSIGSKLKMNIVTYNPSPNRKDVSTIEGGAIKKSYKIVELLNVSKHRYKPMLYLGGNQAQPVLRSARGVGIPSRGIREPLGRSRQGVRPLRDVAKNYVKQLPNENDGLTRFHTSLLQILDKISKGHDTNNVDILTEAADKLLNDPLYDNLRKYVDPFADVLEVLEEDADATKKTYGGDESNKDLIKDFLEKARVVHTSMKTIGVHMMSVIDSIVQVGQLAIIPVSWLSSVFDNIFPGFGNRFIEEPLSNIFVVYLKENNKTYHGYKAEEIKITEEGLKLNPLIIFKHKVGPMTSFAISINWMLADPLGRSDFMRKKYGQLAYQRIIEKDRDDVRQGITRLESSSNGNAADPMKEKLKKLDEKLNDYKKEYEKDLYKLSQSRKVVRSVYNGILPVLLFLIYLSSRKIKSYLPEKSVAIQKITYEDHELKDKIDSLTYLAEEDRTNLTKCFENRIVYNMDITSDQRTNIVPEFDSLVEHIDRTPDFKKYCDKNDFDMIYKQLQEIQKSKNITESASIRTFYEYGKTAVQKDTYSYLDFHDMKDVKHVVNSFAARSLGVKFMQMSNWIMNQMNAKFMEVDFNQMNPNEASVVQTNYFIDQRIKNRLINKAIYKVAGVLDTSQWGELVIKEVHDRGVLEKLGEASYSLLAHVPSVSEEVMQLGQHAAMTVFPPALKAFGYDVPGFRNVKRAVFAGNLLLMIGRAIGKVVSAELSERGITTDDFLELLVIDLKRDVQRSVLIQRKSLMESNTYKLIRGLWGRSTKEDMDQLTNNQETEFIARMLNKLVIYPLDKAKYNEFEYWVDQLYEAEYGDGTQSTTLPALYGEIYSPAYSSALKLSTKVGKEVYKELKESKKLSSS